MSYHVKGYGDIFVYITGGKAHGRNLRKHETKKLGKLEKITPHDSKLVVKTLKLFEDEYSQKNKSQKTVYLEMDTKPTDPKIEIDVKKALIHPGYYGRLPPAAGNLFWSMYKMFLREKMMKNSSRIRMKSRSIIRDYERGIDIEKLTKKYDYPPSSLMRIILKFFYNIKSPDQVKKILKDPIKYKPKGLSHKEHNDLIEQVEWAHENDIIASARQDIVIERADEYEQYIGSFLKKNNIKFTSQEKMVEIQKKKYGRPVATPDFLLETPVYINNLPIAWIDAKHFYGGSLSFIQEKLEKQVSRYNKMWGYGALIFSAGFSDKLTVPGALLVSLEKPSHTKLIPKK
mgnify:CR=1 FL=1